MKNLPRKISCAALALAFATTHLSAEPAPLAFKPAERMTDAIKPVEKIAPFENRKFSLKPGEVVVFTGPENIVIEQRTGWIETALTSALKNLQPKFRHMGWEGDTVYRQNRMESFGTWKENLDAVGATTVFAWFGQMEALDTTKTPTDFEAAYAKLLDALAERTPRIVVVSPTPFEKPSDPRVPDNTPRNAIVKQHAEIARKLAAARGFIFVDLFTQLDLRESGGDSTMRPKLTRDGIHFTPEGMMEVANGVAFSLGLPSPSAGDEPLRTAIVEKNRLWFDTWRCMNWAFAYGDRTTQPFAKATEEYPAFTDYLKQYRPLVEHADETIAAIANGKNPPAPLPAPVQRADPPAPTPDEERASFKVRDGFSVNLFAGEKLGVVKPIQIRWDERGRLWVLCAPSYPQLEPGTRANDYLLMLEDTKGTGVADKVTRVAEGLTMPMGFEFGDGGIYICESTQLIHVRDSHGTGKFDERRVVLSGFGTGDTHQVINSIRWGADGALWFTQGYHIWSYIETPHGITELNRAGVWRFNPRTMKLDSFLNEATAGLNCWGVAFDDFGQVFHGSGANTAIWHTTPALVPTLHPLSLGAGLAISRGKSMEPEFLESSHLPDDLHDTLLKSTFFTSQVQLYKLHDDGAGFKSDDLGDLLASSSKEFRPVESRVGPDGAIYVCDWLNPIIGHYQASYRDPRRDHSHGRIWRVTADGRALLKRPALEKMDAAQLIEQLASPERWVRDQAQHALYRLPKNEAIPAADVQLAKLAVSENARAGTPFQGIRKDAIQKKTNAQERNTPADGSESRPYPAERATLLYEISGVFAAHEEPRPQLVARLLASDDFRLRAWGTHLVGVWAKQLADPLAILSKSIADENPRVRMEAVVASSYVEKPDAVKIATLAMDKPVDFSIDYALTQCIHALAPVWHPALANGSLDFGDRTNALARVLATAGGKENLAMLRKLAGSEKLGEKTRDDLLVTLVNVGGADDLRFVFDYSKNPGVLDALAGAAKLNNVRPGGDVSEGLEKLLGDSEKPVRIAATHLVAAWKSKPQLARVRAIAENAKAPTSERAAAIEALAAIAEGDAIESLKSLTNSPQHEIRDAALAALTPLDVSAAAERAAALLAKIQKPGDATPFLTPLLAQKTGPAALGAALKKNAPDAAAAKLALQWLAFAGRDDAPLIDALNAAAGIAAKQLDYDPKLIAKIVEDAKARGDVKRGEQVFHAPESACLGCHKVGSEGGVLGPDLSAIGRAATPEFIIESILWPKRVVKEGFLLTLVATKDGRQFQGYVGGETPDSLTLRDLTGGPNITLRKSEIASRNSAGTLMPDGLTNAMSDAQVTDLLRYLMELGK